MLLYYFKQEVMLVWTRLGGWRWRNSKGFRMDFEGRAADELPERWREVGSRITLGVGLEPSRLLVLHTQGY